MEVILVEDVPNLGSMGELVSVKPGYGRNYLIPRGYAIQATRGNKKELAHRVRQIEVRRDQLRASASELGSALDGLSVTIARRTGDDGRLFGSVTNRDIEAAIEEQGQTVDRRRIILGEPLKELGIYHVRIKLHADVEATVNVWVASL